MATTTNGHAANSASMPASLRHEMSKGPVVAAGCFDALSARIAEYVGFSALHLTGHGVEATQLGAPDIGLTTLTELAGHVARITGAVGIPMIADVDTGFGGVNNIARTVKELIRSGAGGIHIEDQVNPKHSPSMDGRQILSREEGVGHVKAALAARTDPDFVIVARSDADAISFDELIVRCNLYLEAGADIAFPMLVNYEGRSIHAYSVEEQLAVRKRLVNEINGPVLDMGHPKPGNPTVQQLIDVGINVIIAPTTALEAAQSAMVTILRDLHDKGSTVAYWTAHPNALEHGELAEMLGLSRYLANERDFDPASALT